MHYGEEKTGFFLRSVPRYFREKLMSLVNLQAPEVWIMSTILKAVICNAGESNKKNETKELFCVLPEMAT